MRVLSFFVKNSLALTLNNCMLAGTNITTAAGSVHSVEPLRQKKLLWSYPKIVKYLLKEFANDQAIVQINFSILR